ncbi:type IV toxin-antitoxin system AbiEi family antitoxin domain-containing protein [Brevundimonas olei]|uniref:Type IV toxin-antitoxin system AbiEi family antitoxin domain-containing protein n=1 Tax=Brevundimonas olei TaxID=657642 RepID=A0ABZ2I9Q4_9CAUL
METAGIEGFLTNPRAPSADREGAQVKAFVSEWWKVWKEADTTEARAFDYADGAGFVTGFGDDRRLGAMAGVWCTWASWSKAMTPTALKARVMEEVGRQSGCFTFADIADRLGDDYGRGGTNERRLRRALEALRRSGVVVKICHGLMRAGGGGVGPGLGMIGAVERFMLDNGGVARPEEICITLGLDDAGRRILHRVLEAGRYEPLPTMHDSRRWWTLPVGERLTLVSPGWRIEVDMALENLRAGRPWRAGLGEINARRRAIGQGIQGARDASNLDVDSLLEAVGRMFVADMERGRSSVLIAGGSIRLGLEATLASAWIDLEEGGEIGSAWAGVALSSATWAAVGACLGADAAALSRGSPGWSLKP